MRQRCFRVGSLGLSSLLVGFWVSCGGTGDGDSVPLAPPPEAPTPIREMASEPAVNDENTRRRWVSRSQHAGRRHLEMEVSGAALGDVLTLQVTFINRDEASFALVEELGGEDFLLADADGSYSSPRAFDPQLRRLGTDGTLAPGATRRGQVVFPPPAGESFELRFADFAPIPLLLGEPRGTDTPSAETRAAEASSRRSAPASPPVARSSAKPADRTANKTRRLGRALQQLLDRHAEALESYDLEAYLDTFAQPARRREQRFFENVRSLPLTAVRLKLLERPSADRRQVPVELRYALDGQPPDNPFIHELVLTWKRREGRLWLADLADGGDRPVPWRTADLVVHRSHHFLLATEKELQDELVDLAADAEGAYANLYRQGLPLASGYFVHLVADRQLFGRLAGRPTALGVAIARHAVEGDRVVVNSRAFYVNGSVFSRLRRGSAGADRRKTTVTHELVHLALADRTRIYTPIWLKEGAAVYFSGDLTYDRNRDLVRQGLADIDLERLTGAPVLGQHDLQGKRTADEYVYAGNLVAFLVEQEGRQAFLDFYASFAELSPVELATLALGDGVLSQMTWGSLAVGGGGAGAPLATRLAPRQLEQFYGLDVELLETRLDEWLRLKYR